MIEVGDEGGIVMGVALSHTVHLYARPEAKDRLIAFFTTVLGLQANQVPYVASPEPMYAFEFANGTMLSVEFTKRGLDDQQALSGAWLEIAADDPEDLKQRAEAFGAKRVTHEFTPFDYVQAPGGQVFRIVSSKDAIRIRAKERGIGIEG
jgi:predicted enzyme related to lactoylglutathione lyase